MSLFSANPCLLEMTPAQQRGEQNLHLDSPLFSLWSIPNWRACHSTVSVFSHALAHACSADGDDTFPPLLCSGTRSNRGDAQVSRDLFLLAYPLFLSWMLYLKPLYAVVEGRSCFSPSVLTLPRSDWTESFCFLFSCFIAYPSLAYFSPKCSFSQVAPMYLWGWKCREKAASGLCWMGTAHARRIHLVPPALVSIAHRYFQLAWLWTSVNIFYTLVGVPDTGRPGLGCFWGDLSPVPRRICPPAHLCSPGTPNSSSQPRAEVTAHQSPPPATFWQLFGGLQPFLGSLPSTHESARHLSLHPMGEASCSPILGWSCFGMWQRDEWDFLFCWKQRAAPAPFGDPQENSNLLVVNCCPRNVIQGWC